MTKEYGRGIFAKRDIKKKELLIAEKAMAMGHSDEDTEIFLTYSKDKTL